jgi:hypothetical protein
MALSKTARRAQEAKARRLIEDQKRWGDHLPDESPDLYDYEAAAKILGVAPKTVEGLCTHRKLGYLVRTWRHGVYMRRQRLIPKFALIEYLTTHYQYKPPLPKRPTAHVRQVS